MRAHTLNQLRACKPPSTSPNSTASTPLPTRPKAQPPRTSLLTPERIFLKQTDYRNSIETILATSKNTATIYTLTPTHGNSQNNNTPQNPRIAPQKPFGYPSPSKTFKHVSRQTNVFLRLENRHFAQYAAFYTSSRVAPQSLPHAFCAIFPKTHHIERTSPHTFYAR